MSTLQEQAVNLICNMSDDNIKFLIEIIQRLIPERRQTWVQVSHTDEAAWESFQRLHAARTEIKQYLLDDFDPEKGLEEARVERYGGID